jgi:hypothetical protein
MAQASVPEADVGDQPPVCPVLEIRPAVVVRKLSAGNRTEAGAETHAVLMSVLRTLVRQGRDVLGAMTALLRGMAQQMLNELPRATR